MSDASIVFVTPGTLTRAVPGYGVYHLPRWRSTKTYCGLVIWDEAKPFTVIPIRRDTAENVAQLCRICEDASPDA